MVAKSTIAERFFPLSEQVLQGRWMMPRFTRHDAEALVRLGIVPEDASTELLDGMLVLKDRAARGQDVTMIGQHHRACVERLSALRKVIDSQSRHVESQQPLMCSDTHVPEPDFMVLRGTIDDYNDLPTASDAWCVVEVADASYERDVGGKLRGYAQAGVQQYVIINLRNRTAEIYAGPQPADGTHPPPTIITSDGSLTIRVGDGETFAFPLAQVLP